MKKSGYYVLFLLLFCLCLTGCTDFVPAEGQFHAAGDLAVPPVNISQEVIQDSPENPETDTAKGGGTSDTETEMQETDPPHVHVFAPSSCEEAARCSCGITDGEPGGHRWSDASCTVPQTCSVCGITDGEPGGHTYTDGKCSVCGEPDPDYSVSTASVWIPKTGSKYHSKPNCSNMKNPKQVSLSYAVSAGYEACKKCYS